MKKIISFIILLFLSINLNAQDGYTYTLSHNGGYSFTVSAVSNFDSGGFSPITESYGFVIVLPDGITATFTQYLPAGTAGTPTFVDGANVVGLDPAMSDNDLYLVTTVTNAATLAAHATDAVIPLVTLTVNGSPVSGEISLLSNDSVLANAIGGSLDSFMQVDIIDDAIVDFTNSVVGTSGLSGMTAFNFSTLAVDNPELIEFSIYPNPTSDYITIQSAKDVDNIEIYDLLGKFVLSSSKKHIDVKDLSSGAYLVKVKIDNKTTTKKIIKE